MKLLCDICENAAASLICYADEAALCSLCGSRVHATSHKLASKHQRVPVLSEPAEPVVCDICQVRPSLFFCIEDRALFCKECDVSIHSTSVLTAKHRRFLFTHLQVGADCPCSPSLETISALSVQQCMVGTISPLNGMAVAVKNICKQAEITASAKCDNIDNGGLCNSREMRPGAVNKSRERSVVTVDSEGDRGIGSKEATKKGNIASAPAAINAKAFRSYLMSKPGTFSSVDSAEQYREVAIQTTSSNSRTIGTRKISSGNVPFVAPVLSTIRAALAQEEVSNNRKISSGNVPFVAPVLSTIRAALAQEEVSNNVHNHKNINIDNIKDSIMRDSGNNNSSSDVYTMDVDNCPPVQSDNVSDYLVSGIPDWRLDEMLTDLVGVCQSDPLPSPSQEISNALWHAELDVMDQEH